MWDQGIPGRAHHAEPVIIVFQDPTRFPNWKQFPLKREDRERLQPLINKFLACGLLVPTSSPCNTPILSVKKEDGTWRMVQDLWIINEAVVPLHPTVPNPYVILGEIPPSAKWFTVLDLKDAFFCTSSVQFSHSVISDSLRPHELQLARPPCPSPTPGD